jgi:hypothetical protein
MSCLPCFVLGPFQLPSSSSSTSTSLSALASTTAATAAAGSEAKTPEKSSGGSSGSKQSAAIRPLSEKEMKERNRDRASRERTLNHALYLVSLGVTVRELFIRMNLLEPSRIFQIIKILLFSARNLSLDT